MGELVTDAKVLKSTKKLTSGTGYVYNIQVNTPDNGDEWFGCGFVDPQVKEGDVIEFEITQNGDYTNVDLDTIVILEAAPERQQSSRGNSRSSGRDSGRSNSRNSGRDSGRKSSRGAPARKSSPTKVRGKTASPKAEVDWDKKDRLIRLQSSQNTAIATIALMVNAGAFAVPKKKADAYDAIQALIEDEADRLYHKYDAIVDGTYDQGDDEEYDDDDVPD